MSDFCQVGMDELDRNRTFTDTGSHAFDGSMSNVTHRENTGNTGFQQEGIPLKGPAIRAFPLPDHGRRILNRRRKWRSLPAYPHRELRPPACRSQLECWESARYR